MSTRFSAQLELADPGWLRIDQATLRVSGPLTVVIREMGTVLSDEVVRSLCLKLGILSSGFFFIDPHARYTRFFDEDEGSSPKTYRTEYLWVDEAAAHRWSDLVHWLFVHVRTVQRKTAVKAKVRTEDFFRHIPKGDGSGYFVHEAARALRLKFQIHYVTLGEMIFTILAWRSLIAAISRGEAGASLDELNVCLTDAYESSPLCLWGGVDLLSVGRSGGGTNRRKKLREAWELLNGPSPCLRSEWNALGLHEGCHTPASIQFNAIAQFAIAAGAINRCDLPKLTCDYLNSAIQKNLGSFLDQLGLKRKLSTIGEALLAIERLARFPLLPFYVWQALDGAPKCYLVTPVWTSQRYSVRVDDAASRRCRHLGLALSAVSPMRKIDWTVADDLNCSDGSCFSDADPTVVANVIRLMARPLVEEQLYSKGLKEVRARLREQADAEVQKSIRNATAQAANAPRGGLA